MITNGKKVAEVCAMSKELISYSIKSVINFDIISNLGAEETKLFTDYLDLTGKLLELFHSMSEQLDEQSCMLSQVLRDNEKLKDEIEKLRKEKD